MADITSWQDLADIGTNSTTLADDYVLTVNLDSSSADYYSSTPGGDAWAPIGTFTGTFDGQGYTISDLVVNVTSGYAGLFGYMSGGSIASVGLLSVDITNSGNRSGAVVGFAASSTIDECFSTGTVVGAAETGGIFGRTAGGCVTSDCYSTCTITGTSSLGGIGGVLGGGGMINCYASGDVESTSNSGMVGGVLGTGNVGITNCFAAGDTITTGAGGGVIGTNATATNCGWFESATTDAVYAINTGSASVTYETTDVTDFYDATHDIYDTGTPVWDFSTPIWYEYASDFPKMVAEAGGPTAATDSPAIIGASF